MFGFGTEVKDVTNDGVIDTQDYLIMTGFVHADRDANVIKYQDDRFMNRAIVCSWPFFCLYLFSMPWLSNWANNNWYNYSAEYTVYNQNASVEGTYLRHGMCDTEPELMHCTDGQNFTELALKYRGKAVGCGCGQGVLGEGLCPMTSYGYTLSDFVSTEPGIAAMLGLGFFPLLGTWRNTRVINMLAKPPRSLQIVHMWSMYVFQISYLFWGICSDCIFPLWHAILTVVFLGAFLVHWIWTALICIACMGVGNVESVVTLYVAIASIAVISIGAIPRVFLTLNSVLGVTFFPNWNNIHVFGGLGSYAFWFAEAAGLSLTFGAFPLILIGVSLFPDCSDTNKDGKIDADELEVKKLFELWESIPDDAAEDN